MILQDHARYQIVLPDQVLPKKKKKLDRERKKKGGGRENNL